MSTLAPPPPARTYLPAPAAVPGAAVAGADALREMPAEVALWTWHALRSVLLWAAEEPAQRGGLFEAGAMDALELELLRNRYDPALCCPLAVLAHELADPESASPERVSWTCLCVSDWALGQGAVATGLAFAEAAANAWPEHARYAWMAGRLMRTHGRLREAGSWLRRAARLSVKYGDWETQARSLTALGNLYQHTANYPLARDLHHQVVRVSRRHNLGEQEAMALHDLFVVSTLSGELAEADAFARRAFVAYGPTHPRIPYLAWDVAFFWVRRGDFHAALSVFSKLETTYPDTPPQRLHLHAGMALASAGCGLADVFDLHFAAALQLADDPAAKPTLAASLLEAGEGALLLERWDQAEATIGRALDVANESGESDLMFEAESKLRMIGERQEQVSAPAPAPIVCGSNRTFARALVSALTSAAA